MQQASGNMLYRYRTLPMQWLHFTLLLPLSSLLIILSIGITWMLSQPDAKPASFIDQLVVNFMIAFTIIITVALTSYSIFKLIREILSTRRVYLSVEDSGLRVKDWRGRERFFPWDTISELRFVTLLNLITLNNARMISTIGNFTISTSIQHQKALINEIINRAHLTSVSNEAYQIRYYRPAAGTSVVS